MYFLSDTISSEIVGGAGLSPNLINAGLNLSHSNSSNYETNYVSIFLIILLLIGCSLLVVGYNFNLSNILESPLALCASFILICFLFFIFWYHFFGTTCGKVKMVSNEFKEQFNQGLNQSTALLGQQLNKTTQNMNKLNNPLTNNYQPLPLQQQPQPLPLPLPLPSNYSQQQPLPSQLPNYPQQPPPQSNYSQPQSNYLQPYYSQQQLPLPL